MLFWKISVITVTLFHLMVSTSLGISDKAHPPVVVIEHPNGIQENHIDAPIPEDGEEIVDIQTKWKSDGSAEMIFTSHGRQHYLELTPNRVNFSNIHVRLVGAEQGDEDEMKQNLKNIKFMEDTRRGASVAFAIQDGLDEPMLMEGVFRLGKHQFDFQHNHTSGRARATRNRIVSNYTSGFAEQDIIEAANRKRRTVSATDPITPLHAVVEFVWIFDQSVWKWFNEDVQLDNKLSNILALKFDSPMTRLLKYYAHVASVMNSYYRTINNDKLKIRVDVVGMVVLQSSFAGPNMESPIHTSNAIWDSWGLNQLSSWLDSSEADRILPSYDHVMFGTNLELVDRTGADGVAGVARRGLICNKTQSISLCEMKNLLTATAEIAAHELGHSLGSAHDGDKTSKGCPVNDFIMGTSGGARNTTDYESRFSCCSQRAIYGTIRKVGQCLFQQTAVPNYNTSAINSFAHRYLPGEIYGADDQCYMSHGTKQCSSWVYGKAGTNLCRLLYCEKYSSFTGSCSSNYPAADGTYCGFGKWCLAGSCVAKTKRAYATSRLKCNVEDCYVKEYKCDSGLNTINPELMKCYNYASKCDGVEDCSDGSDESNCDSSCSYFMSRCKSGQCMRSSEMCDGTEDCSDGSDEEYCDSMNAKTCPTNHRKCAAGINRRKPELMECYSNSSACDDIVDCTDGSDEMNCPDIVCPSGYTKCKNGINNRNSDATNRHCVINSYLCDGDNDCNDGSDEANCTSSSNTFSCSSTQFKCLTKRKCVRLSYKCDGDDDCGDGSDEANCPSNRICRSDQFECRLNSQCIRLNYRCDGDRDCRDGSDELNCNSGTVSSCSYGYMRCSDRRQCVRSGYRCDGDRDCRDGSDEWGCPQSTTYRPTCSSSYIACKTRSYSLTCVRRRYVCDGDNDCLDGSDETNCGSNKYCYRCKDAATCAKTESDCRTLCPHDTNCVNNVENSAAAIIGHLNTVWLVLLVAGINNYKLLFN